MFCFLQTISITLCRLPYEYDQANCHIQQAHFIGEGNNVSFLLTFVTIKISFILMDIKDV